MSPAIAQSHTKKYCQLIPTPTFNQEKQFSSGQWVQLIRPLTCFSSDEALLLCQESQGKWVTWVPGFGKKRLDISEFV